MDKYQSPKAAGLILAVCGAASGGLSALVEPTNIEIAGTPMMPALFFSVVIAYGVYGWETRRLLPLAIALAGVWIGWWCAFQIANGLSGPDTPGAYIGAAAGFVGAAITALTLWIAAPDFRSWRNAARIVVFGTTAGALLQFGKGDSSYALLLLFVVWQTGVAALAGYALGLRPRTG